MTADVIGLHGNTPSEGAPKADKIIPFTGITRLDLPVDTVLDMAKDTMMGVIVIGYTKDGEEYFASTYADGGTVLWLLERSKKSLLSEGGNIARTFEV